jgi:hypothetical protein
MLFPVPWANTLVESYLVSPSEMVTLLKDAGFGVAHQEDRRQTAIEHHRAPLKTAIKGEALPPLGLHLLQREHGAQASRNMMAMLQPEQITLQVDWQAQRLSSAASCCYAGPAAFHPRQCALFVVANAPDLRSRRASLR